MKFEHSLPKMMTRRKTSSTNTASGSPQGQSLVVQVSGGTLTRNKQRHPAKSTTNRNLRENRVDTIFGAGLGALLFFSPTPITIADHVIGKSNRAKL
jgi:hypothetical protein